MSKYHLLLFNEQVHKNFPGFARGTSLSSLPLWANFRVSDILEASNMDAISNSSFTMDTKSDLDPLIEFLRERSVGECIILGRTGNIIICDWSSILQSRMKLSGIVKIQVGRIPSELYIMKKREFIKTLTLLSERENTDHENFLSQIFDNYLFHNFERIVNLSGYSYLIRNSFEYYKENLNILTYLRDRGFLGIYRKFNNTHLSSTTVTESGVIKNSVLGGGTRIEGVVENSVIFHDVTIGRDSWIKNSVILPSNRIAEGVMIENSLILERKDGIIGKGSTIGGTADIKNNDYPCALRKGLTVIGEGITVPMDSCIGAGCLVCGRGGEFQSPLEVANGATYRVR